MSVEVGLHCPSLAVGLLPAEVAAAAALDRSGLGVCVPRLSAAGAPAPASSARFPRRLPPQREGRAVADAFPDPKRPGDGPLRRLFTAFGAPELPRRWLIGVAEPTRVETLLPLAARLIADGALDELRFVTTHGPSGPLPTPAPLGPTELLVLDRDGRRGDSWDCREFGIPFAVPAALAAGGTAEQGAAIDAILAGEPGPRRDYAVWIAAHVLMTSGRVSAPRRAVERAEAALGHRSAA